MRVNKDQPLFKHETEANDFALLHRSTTDRLLIIYFMPKTVEHYLTLVDLISTVVVWLRIAFMSYPHYDNYFWYAGLVRPYAKRSPAIGRTLFFSLGFSLIFFPQKDRKGKVTLQARKSLQQ